MLIISLFLISIVPASAEDAMFRANPEHTGVYGNAGTEPGNSELWHFATGGIVYSSPLVANGIVYVGSEDKNLYALDAVTGKEKWKFTTGDHVFTSPTVATGAVFVGSEDKNLYAVDAATGTEKWRFAMGGWVDSSPILANGIVYVGSNDKNLYAIGANSPSLTTVPTTIRATDTKSPTSRATTAHSAIITTTVPARQTTQPAPLRYAPLGAVVLVFGIMAWKRQ